MEQLFKKPKSLHTKVQLEERRAEDEPRKWKKAERAFPESACRILGFLSDRNTSAHERAASLAGIISPKATALEKQLLEGILAKDIARLEGNWGLLEVLQWENRPDFLIAAEIEVARGELRGIDAPAGGVKIVVRCKPGVSFLACYKREDTPGLGISIFPSNILSLSPCISISKYRGVLIYCTARCCWMVGYDDEKGFSFRTLAKDTLIRDDTTNPPTLIGFHLSSSFKHTITRYGDILENGENALECLVQAPCKTVFNFTGMMIDGELLGFAIDESGNIWVACEGFEKGAFGEINIFGPDLIHLETIVSLPRVSVYTSPLGGACIYSGSNAHGYRVKYVRREQAALRVEAEPESPR